MTNLLDSNIIGTIHYILVYADDNLVISYSPNEHLLDCIKVMYNLNLQSTLASSYYYWANNNVEGVTHPGDLTDRQEYPRSFSALTYVKNSVRGVKGIFQEEDRGLKTTAKTTPFPNTTYQPEMDTTDECSNDGASHYS